MRTDIFTAIILCVVLPFGMLNCDIRGNSGSDTFSVVYRADEADAGTVPVDGNAYRRGDTAVVLGNENGLSRDGYSFSGWSTASDGTGDVLLPGGEVEIEDEDIELFALWERIYIVIDVASGFFKPAMEFSADAEVTVDYGDGTLPVTFSAGSGPVSPDTYLFADGASLHQVRILVDPWEALSVINLGFRGGDGGNGDDERLLSDLPYIEFHPSFDEIPDDDADEPKDVVLDNVGTVTAIENLSVAAGLTALCCEYQPIEVLDLSDCGNILTLEAYFSSITTTNFQGCVSLRRCCLEATGAMYNWRVEDGDRIDDEVLDLRDCSDLRDIRGTGDDHVMMYLHPDAVAKLWHLCKTYNSRLTEVKIGDEEPAKLDIRRFTNLIQCWLSYSPVIEDAAATDANASLYSVWLSGCGVQTLDIENQTQIRYVDIDDNPLTDVNIRGCANLIVLKMHDCGLPEAMVDGILEDLDESLGDDPASDNLITLDGTNDPPSAAGLVHAEAMRSRGWNISINESS